MHFRNTVNVFIASLLLGGVAAHAAPNNAGAYAGVGVGAAFFYDNGMIDDINREIGYPRLSFENTATGFKLYGGYAFGDVVAVEAAYTRYGNFKVKDNLLGTSENVAPSSLSVSANLGYGFLNDQMRVFVLAGLSYMDLDKWVEDDTGMGLHVGFGFQYDPEGLDGFGFRMAYEEDAFSIGSGYSGNRYLKEDYLQALGMLYLGAHYRF